MDLSMKIAATASVGDQTKTPTGSDHASTSNDPTNPLIVLVNVKHPLQTTTINHSKASSANGKSLSNFLEDSPSRNRKSNVIVQKYRRIIVDETADYFDLYTQIWEADELDWRSVEVRPDDSDRCVVCSRAGIDSDYGAFACFSCQALFKQMIFDRCEFTCKRTESCRITFKTTRPCKVCHYQKCIQQGLMPHFVIIKECHISRLRFDLVTKLIGQANDIHNAYRVSLDNDRPIEDWEDGFQRVGVFIDNLPAFDKLARREKAVLIARSLCNILALRALHSDDIYKPALMNRMSEITAFRSLTSEPLTKRDVSVMMAVALSHAARVLDMKAVPPRLHEYYVECLRARLTLRNYGLYEKIKEKLQKLIYEG